MSWTADRVERLKAFHQNGKSASEIAILLGAPIVSRNAVLGKLHRLGLCEPLGQKAARRDAFYRERQRQLNTRRAPERKPRLPIEPLPPPHVDDVARVTIHDLEDAHCRWPVGDPRHTEFGFCGLEKTPGLSYCAGHVARAVRNVQQPAPKAEQLRRSRYGFHMHAKRLGFDPLRVMHRVDLRKLETVD